MVSGRGKQGAPYFKKRYGGELTSFKTGDSFKKWLGGEGERGVGTTVE